jgi:hypothetical protein
MAACGEGLRAFYGGPVWAAHRDAANATMIDSDNVFLLRPVDKQSRRDLDASRRRAPGVASVTICPLGPGRAPAFARHFAEAIEPALRAAGANVGPRPGHRARRQQLPGAAGA